MAKLREAFTRQHYDGLKKTQRELADMLSEFDKLGECGLDCTAWREIHREMTANLEAFERHYLPSPPSK